MFARLKEKVNQEPNNLISSSNVNNNKQQKQRSAAKHVDSYSSDGQHSSSEDGKHLTTATSINQLESEITKSIVNEKSTTSKQQHQKSHQDPDNKEKNPDESIKNQLKELNKSLLNQIDTLKVRIENLMNLNEIFSFNQLLNFVF